MGSGPALDPREGPAPLGMRAALLRVELDDELLLDRHRDVLARRRGLHGPLEAALVELEPGGDAAAIHGLQRLVDADDLLGAVLQADGVARAAQVARDVHLPAVHGEVA